MTNDLLDTARKGAHLLRTQLPKDGNKVRAVTQFLEAVDNVVAAIADNKADDLEYWSAKAKIRSNDMTGDTMRIIAHGKPENTAPVEFVAALAKGETPNLAPLELWLSNNQLSRAA